MTLEIETIHAEKRWGHGVIPRKATRLYCNVVGHRWRGWNYDWPEFDITDDIEVARAIEFGPTQEEPLLWMRGCTRNCGTVQHTTLPLNRRQELPT